MSRSELAVVAFILSLLGFIIPFFNILAIIMGIAGLMHVKRQQLRGKGLAITAIILGFLSLILYLLFIVVAVSYIQSFLSTFNPEEFLAGQFMN